MNDRIDVRMNRASRDLIMAAADLRGLSLRQFIVNSAIVTAEQVIKEHHLVVLKQDDMAQVMRRMRAERITLPELRALADAELNKLEVTVINGGKEDIKPTE